MRYLLFACAAFLTFSCSDPEDSETTKPEPSSTETPEKEVPDEPEPEEEGSDPVLVVKYVFPEQADLGDTLNLKGANFNRDVRLSLGVKQLKILFNNDSIIQFELPYWGFDADSLNISIDNRDTIVNYKNAFQLYEPVIDSIPSNFGFRDTVIVYGKHLTNHPNARDGIVGINGQTVTAIHQNKDSIGFVLPYYVDKHENDLSINAQLQNILVEKGVVVPDPKIIGASKDSVFVGDELTIYGTNFYPIVTHLNEVLIDGKQTEVLEAYRDSLVVRIPLGPYKDRDIGNISVKILGNEVEADLGFHLANKWYLYGFKRESEINRTASVGSISRESFYYNNAMYFSVYDYIDGLQYSSSSNYRLHKYTPEEDHWEQQADLPVLSDVGRGEYIQLFSIGDGNLYIHVDRQDNNFFKYNLEAKTLIELEDFDVGYRVRDAVGFIHNGNFYFGAGAAREFDRSVLRQNRKFWKYNEALNSWTEISEIPEVPGQYEYAFYYDFFMKDGKVYIYNGNRVYETWEFTPDETWVRKSDLENPVGQTVFTQIGDNGFFYHYGDKVFYEYDIVNDHWSRREDLKIEGYNPQRETMFVHGNHVYLVGYKSGYPPEYNGFSINDHLILRTELSNFTN